MAHRLPLRTAFNLHVPDLSEAEPSGLSCATSRHSPIGRPYTVLSAWSSFEAEVEKFAEEQTRKFPAAMFDDQRDLKPESWSTASYVNTEKEVEMIFVFQVLRVTASVLRAMSCPGFATGSTKSSVFGNPNRIWILERGTPAVMCIVVKSPWHLRNVTNIIEQCSSANCDEKLRASVEQLYGYMSVNDHKYGILTTYESTWIFRRGGNKKHDPSHQVLQVAGPFRSTPLSEILERRGGGKKKISVIGALTFLLHQVTDDWMHFSPCNTPRIAEILAEQPQLECSYTLVTLAVEDQRIMLCDRLPVQGNSQIIKGKLHGITEDVIFKAVDAYNGGEFLHELEKEVENYRLLEKLQGNVIPKFLGYFNKGGVLHLIALEICGAGVKIVTKADKEAMKDLLCKLHAEGFVHGDAALRNFVKDASGKWRLIDLGRAKATSDEEARKQDFDDLAESLQSKELYENP